MEEIIITGATGFIGRSLIKELIKIVPGEKILCLIKDRVDELESSGRKVLEEFKIKTKEIDLPSGRGLNNLPANPKIVIHLGASTESGDPVHTCNDIGTRNLLEALTPISPDTKIIFTSTAAIYSGRKDLDIPIDENTIPIPSNEYGRSKLRAEQTLREFALKFGFKCIVLRLATVWGEGTRKNGLFDTLKTLIPKKSIIPRLNWPGKTSLIYVEDVVQIIMYFIKNKTESSFQTFILSHEALTLSEISKALHRRLNIQYVSLNIPAIFWKTSKSLILRSYVFDEYLSPKTYNTFWRLNLILNDSLYCKPNEIMERIPEMKITMKSFS